MTANLYHIVRYTDALAGAAFLEAIGFTRRVLYTNSDDPTRVDHAQFAWRDNGGVMMGSRPTDDTGVDTTEASCYLVVESDDEVDAVYRRALEAGASVVHEPRNPEYGGREASLRDPEGNYWSVGSYAGE